MASLFYKKVNMLVTAFFSYYILFIILYFIIYEFLVPPILKVVFEIFPILAFTNGISVFS